MGFFSFIKSIFSDSKNEKAKGGISVRLVTPTSENKDLENELNDIDKINQKREKRLKKYLQEQAKNTLELFSGIDEETKEKVLEKFDSVKIYMRISKKFELEMFSLFEGCDFVWQEYEYLKKWSLKNGITTHWAGRFCYKETPLNIIRLFIWTVINRAYDAKAKEEFKEVGFKRSDLSVVYENDLKILKRFSKLKTLPWKHDIHPITPGLMCSRVPLSGNERAKFEVSLD